MPAYVAVSPPLLSIEYCCLPRPWFQSLNRIRRPLPLPYHPAASTFHSRSHSVSSQHPTCPAPTPLSLASSHAHSIHCRSRSTPIPIYSDILLRPPSTVTADLVAQTAMAASSSSFQRGGGERRGRWGSPERTVVWTEPKHHTHTPKPTTTRKVAVVYYLCHLDGHLDHPHFLEMELPVSSSHRTGAGLYLRDFTARLDALRGSGMPAMYAWSAKRGYRNGYVWQDLAEDDLVHPAHGADEYVLKGSPLLLFPQQQPPPPPPAVRDASSNRRRKNWSSFDLGEYSNSKLAALQRAGAAQQQSAATQTQTDHRRGPDLLEESTELAIDEISPPPSSGSPDDICGREVGVIAGGRMRASAMLMQLFSCGSMRGHARGRSDLPTTGAGGSSRHAVEKEADDACATPARADCSSGGGGGIGTGLGDITERDYFSGSLVESSSSSKTRSGGDAALLLKRSSSCNADRGAAKLKVPAAAAREQQVVRAGCLASRGRGTRAPAKKSQTKSTAAAESSRVEGGECTNGGATTEPAADGAGRS